MVTLLTILALIASILLILIVLIQKPKGGGITNNLTGGANQIFGVKKTSDIVEKSTWILSGAIAVILLITSVFNPAKVDADDEVQDLTPSKEIEKAMDNPGAVKQPTPNPFQGTDNSNAPGTTEPANTNSTDKP